MEGWISWFDSLPVLTHVRLLVQAACFTNGSREDYAKKIQHRASRLKVNEPLFDWTRFGCCSIEFELIGFYLAK